MLGSTLFAEHSLAQSSPTNPPAAPCSAAEHRAFDFWIGEWKVERADTGAAVADSKIETLYGGCAIRENWMPIGSDGGGSLNAWIPHLRLWRQTWVDSSGGWVDFTGGPVDKAMILTGHWRDYAGAGKDMLIRMTYKHRDDGTVLQLGEQSTDFGKNWSITFGFIYRPKERPAK
jgi:hypothetical protein